MFSAIVKIEKLERLMVNFSRNKLEDLKYIGNTLLESNTINISTLELKMHHIDVPIEGIIEFIGLIKELF